MKKILLAILGFTTFTVAAQSIEIKNSSDESVSGDTLTVNYSLTDLSGPLPYGFYANFKLYVHNLTSNDMRLRIKRVVVSGSNLLVDDLCWPPNCFTNNYINGNNGLTPGNESTPLVLANSAIANTLDLVDSNLVMLDVAAEIKPQFYGANQPFSTLIKYIVTDSLGTTGYDTVYVNVNYTHELSVASTPKLVTELTMAPNPATDYVTINAEGLTEARLKVVDVLGSVVYSSDFNNSKKINLADFKNGIYFVTVNAGNKTLTKKLVVRH